MPHLVGKQPAPAGLDDGGSRQVVGMRGTPNEVARPTLERLNDVNHDLVLADVVTVGEQGVLFVGGLPEQAWSDVEREEFRQIRIAAEVLRKSEARVDMRLYVQAAHLGVLAVMKSWMVVVIGRSDLKETPTRSPRPNPFGQPHTSEISFEYP